MAEFKVPVKFAKDGSLEKALDELEKELEDVVRGMTVQVYDNILRRTPQYYGRMVASWTYSLGYPVFVDHSRLMDPLDEEGESKTFVRVRSKGDMEAIRMAKSFVGAVDTYYKLGDTVWISNGVNHGEGDYSGAVESGAIKLRHYNRPGDGVKRTLDMIQTKYGREAGVSKYMAQRLKGYKLGRENA